MTYPRVRIVAVEKGVGSSPVDHPPFAGNTRDLVGVASHFDTTAAFGVHIRSGLDNRGARVAY